MRTHKEELAEIREEQLTYLRHAANWTDMAIGCQRRIDDVLVRENRALSIATATDKVAATPEFTVTGPLADVLAQVADKHLDSPISYRNETPVDDVDLESAPDHLDQWDIDAQNLEDAADDGSVLAFRVERDTDPFGETS